MQIFVKINEVARVFEVEPTDLIENLIFQIEDKFGIPKDRQRLYFYPEILDEKKSFIEYNINKENRLELKVLPPKNYAFVNYKGKEIKTIIPRGYGTIVLELKKGIKDDLDIDVESQDLYFNGKYLVDTEFLVYNNIYNNSKLELIKNEYLKCKKEEISSDYYYPYYFVKISEPILIYKGFFYGSDFSYKVNFYNINDPISECIRKFSDFEWLYQTLYNLYGINCLIPSLNKKIYESTGIIFNSKTSFETSELIEIFMNKIISHPLFGKSKILNDFLMIKDNNEFEKYKEYYNNLDIPSKPEEVRTLTGTIKIGINDKKLDYLLKIKNDFDKNQFLIEQLANKCKLLNDKNKEIISLMKEIESISGELNKNHNKKEEMIENKINIKIYETMEKYLGYLRKIQENENKLWYELYNKMTYKNMVYKSLNDYYIKYNDIKNKLLDSCKQYINDKDKKSLSEKDMILKIEELNKAKISNKEYEIKKLFGCYLNSLVDEYQKLDNYDNMILSDIKCNMQKMPNSNLIVEEIKTIEDFGEEHFVNISEAHCIFYSQAHKRFCF